MSRFTGFLHQSSHYSIAQFLLIFASTISFPILTRIFSPAEYGVMNLVSNAIVILLAVSKGGLQHGIVRFHNDYDAGSGNDRTFVASALFGGFGIAAAVALLWFSFIFVLIQFRVSDPMIEKLLLLSGGLVFLRATENLLLAFLRAEQRTIYLNMYRVFAKYFTLGVIFLLLFGWARTLVTFYAAQAIAMGLACGIFLRLRFRNTSPQLAEFSPQVFKQVFMYGLPLIGFELGSVVLNFADRYLIQIFHGSNEVGFYSAGYNLADYVKDLVVLPMATAVMPIYMQTWAQKGAQATRAFLRKALKSYMLLAVPLIFGCAAVGRDLISVLASAKFLSGSAIIPWVIAGMMLNGALPILAAGLYIHKKTSKLVLYLALAIVLNVGLNLWAIPQWSIHGAAITKLLSFTVLVVLATQHTLRELHLQIPWRALASYTLAALVMYCVLIQIKLPNAIASLAINVFAGAAIYLAIVWVLDASVRERGQALLRKLSFRSFSREI